MTIDNHIELRLSQPRLPLLCVRNFPSAPTAPQSQILAAPLQISPTARLDPRALRQRDPSPMHARRRPREDQTGHDEEAGAHEERPHKPTAQGTDSVQVRSETVGLGAAFLTSSEVPSAMIPSHGQICPASRRVC